MYNSLTTKITLPGLVKIHVTNICNLTCDGCNRFNNFHFRGWQRWSDYAEDYQKWGKIFQFTEDLTILGGEPLLNADIAKWVRGIGSAFDVPIQIRTNGTYLNQTKNLYDALAEPRPFGGGRNYIVISLHNRNDFSDMRKSIFSFLQGKVQQTVKEGSRLTFSDSNGVTISIQVNDTFIPSSILNPSPGRYILHHNDPIEAHKTCQFVKYKSHHFSKGKLYKCPPADLRPEFDLQNRLDISDEDRALLNSYQPLTLNNFDDYHEEFLDSLNNPVPQCKFCPIDTSTFKIFPVHKGKNR